ncbi:MAG TPA: prealbumin-like fold domain-containing protein [Armatimonadota bacterium]|nr:prealbumin-like fold domain-containing protein [Armatimonadota bacterium]
MQRTNRSSRGRSDSRRQWMAAAVAALVIGLALNGCGSGGNGLPSTNTRLEGQVLVPQGQTLPTLTAKVEGTSVVSSVSPTTGTFTLVGAPTGSQTIQILDVNGMVVESVPVTIASGSAIVPPLPAPTIFTAGAASGIAGTVYKGPISPVTQNGASNEEPLANATLQIMSADGATLITSVTSGSDGSFSVDLPPGTYKVVPISGTNGFPHASPFTVTVNANEVSNITVNYDTGIR